ncbi:hypothetical protein ElyMa_004593000 [Elysia marginata]|uniref:Uncharacterized protein n=1 Tax=Elysia marginata TaxID=1093978 RepID=A0AAV4HWY7_9GAST|nr:hypothetical protein ElyMa_004593000 [Elysia marginata]
MYYGKCQASKTGYSDINEKLEAIAVKVDAIDAKLDSLAGGQYRYNLLTRIDQRLDNIDSKLDVLAPQGGLSAEESSVKSKGVQEHKPEAGQEVEEDQEDYPYYNCVDLISVERYPTADGNTFTVKFTKNVQELSVRYQEEMGPAKPVDTFVEEEGGVWSVSFFSKQTGERQQSPWISFRDTVDEKGSFLSSRHELHLNLNNSVLSHSLEMMEPLPELHADPPRDVVYEPGQDFNVTVFVPLNNIPSHDFYIHESFPGINISSGKAYMNMERRKIFRDLEDDSDENKKVKSLTVLTSSVTLSGYLSFNFGIDLEGPIVKTVQVSRIIMVRPSNQSTVLPPGFLGFFENPHMGLSQNGNELRRCGLGVKCMAWCHAVGDPISDIQVLKILPDGRHETVPSATSPDLPISGDTLQVVFWEFVAEEDDSNGLTTFQCVATDQSRGRVVSKLVDILVMLPDGLDEDGTNVTVMDDHMDPHIKHLIFNCAVYGRPLPEVSISGGTSQIFSMDSYEPDSVIHTGRSTAVMTKNLTIDVDYYRRHNYRLYEDDELPYCGFFSSTRGEYITHTYDVPDFGLSES